MIIPLLTFNTVKLKENTTRAHTRTFRVVFHINKDNTFSNITSKIFEIKKIKGKLHAGQFSGKTCRDLDVIISRRLMKLRRCSSVFAHNSMQSYITSIL